jgi:hypothetical protein
MLKYVSKIGLDRFSAHKHQQRIYAGRLLKRTHGLRLISTAKGKTSVLFFVLEGFETAEVGAQLDTKMHCSGQWALANRSPTVGVDLHFIPDFWPASATCLLLRPIPRAHRAPKNG